METKVPQESHVEFLGSARVTLGLYIATAYPGGENVGTRIAEHREQVKAIREAGFTSIAVGQHFLTQPIQHMAPIPYVASLIDITGDMRLILGVALLPLLHPVLLAEDVSSLDWLSGGRVVLGAGIGYRPEEFAAMGVSLHDRVTRFNECLRVMKLIWTESRWSFEGKHYRYQQLPAGLAPKQKPYPPVWVAADVDAAVGRAARMGAAWYINPRAKLEFLKRQLEIYDVALAKYGHQKPKVFPIRREAFVAESEREARAMAGRYLRRMLALYAAWGQYEVMPEADRKDREFDEDSIPDTYLVGTPDKVAEMIARYQEELGVNHIVLRMQWPGMPHKDVMRSIELVGSRLIPAFG